MKRYLISIFVLTLFFSLLGETMAASKPPAKLCLDMNPALNSFVVIVTKSVASVTMADGATAFYSVNGAIFASPGHPQWNAPLVGTGHMYKDADVDWFHFSASGFTVSPYGFDIVSVEVFWDVVTKTGTLHYLAPGTGYKSTITPVERNCATIEIPPMP
jgi:hypothetical protein